MTSGGEETTAWWGKMKDDRDKMSSTFVLSLVAFLFALSFLIVMIMVICKKCKRRRAAKLAASSLSLPPPYEVLIALLTLCFSCIAMLMTLFLWDGGGGEGEIGNRDWPSLLQGSLQIKPIMKQKQDDFKESALKPWSSMNVICISVKSNIVYRTP